MESRKFLLLGTVFASALYVSAFAAYLVLRVRFFAFCFGLAAILSTAWLLTRFKRS